jgi:hypothetical protein
MMRDFLIAGGLLIFATLMLVSFALLDRWAAQRQRTFRSPGIQPPGRWPVACRPDEADMMLGFKEWAQRRYGREWHMRDRDAVMDAWCAGVAWEQRRRALEEGVYP